MIFRTFLSRSNQMSSPLVSFMRPPHWDLLNKCLSIPDWSFVTVLYDFCFIRESCHAK